MPRIIMRRVLVIALLFTGVSICASEPPIWTANSTNEPPIWTSDPASEPPIWTANSTNEPPIWT